MYNTMKTFRKPYKKQNRDNTFAAQVRKMEVGDVIMLGGEYLERQSAYMGARRALPEAKFSIKTVNHSKATLTRIS